MWGFPPPFRHFFVRHAAQDACLCWWLEPRFFRVSHRALHSACKISVRGVIRSSPAVACLLALEFLPYLSPA